MTEIALVLQYALKILAEPGGQAVLQRLAAQPDLTLRDLDDALASLTRPTPPGDM